MKDLHLLIERVPIAALKLHPCNPRHHSDRQIKQIARSIETFGFNVPVLIDRSGQVLAGHGRVRASEKLGLMHVPAIKLEHLTEAQAKAFMIADNRLVETSEWNERLLAEALKDLSVLELDFSIEATGFEIGEIDFRIESLGEGADEAENKVDILPAAGQKAVSQVGDCWFLGDHRICCGNALEARTYEDSDGRRTRGDGVL
jgi:ParB-like chromosome segregation protein Spo0J